MNNVTMEVRLVRIKESSFNLQADHKTEKILQVKDLQVGININTIPFLLNNQIKLRITIDYHYIDNTILVEPLFYSMEIWFDVKDLANFVEEKRENVLIKHELLSMLLGVSIGTIRGMMAHRCKNTVFENYPLPIINVTHLMANLQNNNHPEKNIDIPPIFLSKIH